MIVRKLRFYRMNAKMSLAACENKLGISRNRMFKLETCVLNFKPEETEYLADFFKTTVDEITKLIDMDVVRKAKNKFGFVINREDISKEETEMYLANLKKNSSISQRQFKLKRIEKVREANKLTKSFKCLNQACRLNSTWTKGCNGQKCMCDNPVVIRGDAPCYGRNRVQDKPKNQNFINTNVCFMTDTVSKEERKRHYAL